MPYYLLYFVIILICFHIFQLTEQAPQRSSLFPLRVVHISIPLHSIASVEVQELDLPLLLSELPSEQQERILTDTTFRTTGAPFPQSTLSSGSRQITPPSFDGTGSAANSARKFQIPPGDRRVISSSLSTSTYPNSGAVGAADLVIVSPELIGGQTRRLPVVIVQTKVLFFKIINFMFLCKENAYMITNIANFRLLYFFSFDYYISSKWVEKSLYGQLPRKQIRGLREPLKSLLQN